MGVLNEGPVGRSMGSGIGLSLVGLVLVAVLPLLVFGGGVAWMIIDQEKTAVAAELASTASALRVAVDRELLSQFAAMEILATDPSLDSGSPAAFHERARRAVEAHKEWYNVALIDPVTHVMIVGAQPTPDPAPTTLSPADVDQTVRSRKPVIAGMFASGKVTMKPVILFYSPVMRGGQIRFVLAVVMNPKRLSDLFMEQRLPSSWTGAVVDDHMTVAGRSRNPERYVGKLATPTLADRIAASESGMFTALNQEGAVVYTVFSRSPLTGWSVPIGIPAEEVEQPIRHVLLQMAAAGGSLMTFALILTGLVGKEIVRRRNAYERALADFNRDFETFLEQTTDFIYFKDRDSRFRFCSQTMAKITGHASWRDMIGKHDLEVFPADTARIYQEEEYPIFTEGKPLLDKIDPYYDADGRLGYVQTSKLPLFDAQGKVVGIFGISRDITERKMQQDSLERLVQERTAQLRAMAIKLTTTEERERHVVAEDLHDGLGQSLAIAKLKLSALNPLYAGCPSCSKVIQEVKEIEALIDEANQAVRSLSLQLSPPVLHELDLLPALEWLADEMRRSYGLRVNVHNDGQSKHLDETVLKAVFRAARELLINVAKHAQVNVAEVATTREGDRLVLSVSDSGVGFDASKLSAPSPMGGYGLFSVRERIGFVGGDVQIDSSPGDGTVVVLTVPLTVPLTAQHREADI